MKLTNLFAVALATALPAAAFADSHKVVVKLSDAKGADIGTATLTSARKGVSIALDLHGLPPGVHAIHVHETAKCDAPDFKSSGGHFNPDKKHHGLKNPQGPHAGDMPNFTVDRRGNAHTTVMASGISLGEDEHSVFSNGGTALVIHAKADDMKSDPSGNAGARIACGVIEK